MGTTSVVKQRVIISIWLAASYTALAAGLAGVTAPGQEQGGWPQLATASLARDAHWMPHGHVGPVSGVAVGEDDTIWAVHRGGRVWGPGTYIGPGWGERVADESLVHEAVVVQLDRGTGKLLRAWGADTFNLPHMVSLDPEDNVWVVDTGLHQALKFSPDGRQLLALGQRFEPGHDADHLCMPTEVAVASNGTIYVSDGYCNARVMQYSPAGVYQGDFQLPEGANVSHSLVLDERLGALLVADRESGKVQWFSLETREWQGTWDVSKYGPVFSLALGPDRSLFAQTWARDTPEGTGGHLLLLAPSPADGVQAAWPMDGVKVPHDMTLVAAASAEPNGRVQPLTVFVADMQADSRLLKYTLLPGDTGCKSVAADAGADSCPNAASA